MNNINGTSPYSLPGIEISEQVMTDLILKRFPKVNPELLPSKLRKREYVNCRMFLSCFQKIKYPDKTLQDIGLLINRDHSSVLYYFSLLTALYDVDLKVRKLVDDLCRVCLISDYKLREFLDYASYLQTRN